MATGGKAESWSEAYIEYPCYVCEKDSKQSDSGHYCLFCKTFLCLNCLSGHNKFTADHQVLAVSDTKFQKVLTERCMDHPDEVIELYCQKHDALLCNMCERLGHRKCEDVKKLSDSSNELSSQTEIQAVPDKLKSALKQVNWIIDSLDKNIESVIQKGQAYRKELDDYEQKLLEKLKELKTKSMKDIEHAQQQIISAANESRKECVKIKENICQCMEEVQRSQNRMAHLIVVKKKGQVIVERARNVCRESENMIKDSIFSFRSNKQIADSLNSFSSLVTQVKLYKIRHVSNTDLKIKYDKNVCNIYGICCLGDGNLVLTDLSNNRLKRLDPSNNNVIDHCDMSEGPVGVCSIGPHEVAVADGKNNAYIISALQRLTRTRTVDMGHETSRLACHGGEMFASYRDRLWVHDMTGQLLRDISGEGQTMFSDITGIAMNQTGDSVYVSDWNNGLLCVTRDGQLVFRLSCKVLGVNGAWGVATDNRGNVMVAGGLSHNVVQVTEEGMVVGEIMAKKDGIQWPLCLCFHSDLRILYVGGFKSRLQGVELL